MGASTEYTQANRPLRVETALGPDVLLLTGFSGAEGVSQPYTFDLDVMSLQNDVDPAEFLRKPVLITVDQGEGEPRYIHGIASRLAQLGTRDDLAFYRARIVPWLWFLGLSRESRIYQNMTVPAILEQIFKDHGYTDYDLRLTSNYAERIYCVQYRETHLDFVTRLMEDEGIYYYFEHSDDKHVLVLADDNSISDPSPGTETLEFMSDEEHADNVVMQLERVHSVHPGKVTLWDYDYLQPNVKLTATYGDEDEEVYDFPGNFTDPGDGLVRAGNLWEVETGEEAVVRGTSNAPGLTPGYNFTLKHHYRRDANVKYLLTEVRHAAHMGGYRGWGDGAALDYRVEFFAIPNETPYVPPRRTPRPVMWSSQTALVVGPKGEEVHVDKYGRIKVQFYWDREGKRDENSSCWVRVATPWGGKGYGSVSIPRIGNEVVIAFEEGDPDRPLVIGSVYNALQMPPFGLPGAGIQMGMKSRSSPGGGGYNEITMTDTKGKELITIHGQFDMNTTVEHDQTTTVHHNQRNAIDNDQSNTVGANRTDYVGKNESITIAVNRKESVGGNEDVDVTGNRSHAISGNESLRVLRQRKHLVALRESIKVGLMQSIAVGASQSTTVGLKQSTKVGKDQSNYIGGKRTSTVGKDDNLKVGKKLVIDAGDEIEIKSGQASITLKKNGDITIKGMKISVNGSQEVTIEGTKISSEASTSNLTKGATVNSEASAVNTIKGSLVKIN